MCCVIYVYLRNPFFLGPQRKAFSVSLQFEERIRCALFAARHSLLAARGAALFRSAHFIASCVF
jgi:hypothetical protein